MEEVKFPCGCSFINDGGYIKFKPDFETLILDCQDTWDLISDGDTKGVFQLESFLGERFSEKIKPRTIMELADLISLLRPGTMQAFMEDGENLVEHYRMRKFNEEETSYLHDILVDILKNTYGILVYQEQAIEIGKKVAGFTLSEADEKIRKVLGKKQSDKIPAVEKDFMKGCKLLGLVDDPTAESIFSWIAAGQRYSFNASHAVSYALGCYLSAYVKCHFPVPFFKHSLIHSKYKNKDKKFEMKKMIVNAKSHGIEILPPDLRKANETFEIECYYGKNWEKRKCIRFGLTDIKNVSSNAWAFIKKNHDEIVKCNWVKFLFHYAYYIESDCMVSLIDAGALDYFLMNRKKMKYQYKLFNDLTETIVKNVKRLELDNYSSLQELLEYVAILDVGKGNILVNKKQKEKIEDIIKLLNSPPESLEYSMEQVERIERELLNFPISCTRLDSNISASVGNMKCAEFINSGVNKNIVIAGILQGVKIISTKNGTPMCFLSLMDESGELDDIVGFTEFTDKYKEMLFEDNSVLISGNRSYKNRKSLVAEEMVEI